MSTFDFRKHELVVVMRHHGWKGDESRLKKEQIESWLLSHNVSTVQAAEIIRRFKSGNLDAGGQQRNAAAGVTQQEVLRLIESAFGKAGAMGDEERVRQWIADAVASAQPQKIVVNESIKAQVKIAEGTHPLFEKVLKLVVAGVNVLLVGPAGCGKTTLGHHVALALKRRFGMLSCTSGASESQLTGYLLPVEAGGRFAYVPSEFVDCYESGDSLFLLDELDAADPNMLLVINSALANGSLHVPQRFKKPRIERGKNVAIMAAANTYGTGADMIYAGRNQLDAATLDRFYVVKMDYDRALETRSADRGICEWAWALRAKAAEHKLRRVVSTRTIMKTAAAVAAGVSLAEAKRDALHGWTRDELAKVGEAVI